MRKPTCILCDEPEFLDGLCEGHNDEFCDGPNEQKFNDFVRGRVHAMREAALKYMECVASEVSHMRMRAREFKAQQINGFTLANSVLKHCDVIAKEK